MNTYEEVYKAVFSEPYYGRAWKGPGRLPVYKQTLTSFIQGLFSHEPHRLKNEGRISPPPDL